MAATAAEREALTQQLPQLHTRAAEQGAAARLSEAEQQMASLATTLQQADQEHAVRVTAMLDKLQVWVGVGVAEREPGCWCNGSDVCVCTS
jgi:hypothetical protein